MAIKNRKLSSSITVALCWPPETFTDIIFSLLSLLIPHPLCFSISSVPNKHAHTHTLNALLLTWRFIFQQTHHYNSSDLSSLITLQIHCPNFVLSTVLVYMFPCLIEKLNWFAGLPTWSGWSDWMVLERFWVLFSLSDWEICSNQQIRLFF